MTTATAARPVINDVGHACTTRSPIFSISRAVHAVQLGLHTWRTVSHLSRGREGPPPPPRRGTRMVLDCLVPLDPRQDGADYLLTPLPQRYLVKDSPEYIGRHVRDRPAWQDFAHLNEVVRTGIPLASGRGQSGRRKPSSLAGAQSALYGPEPGRGDGRIIGPRLRDDARILDVALRFRRVEFPAGGAHADRRGLRTRLSGLDSRSRKPTLSRGRAG